MKPKIRKRSFNNRFRPMWDGTGFAEPTTPPSFDTVRVIAATETLYSPSGGANSVINKPANTQDGDLLVLLFEGGRVTSGGGAVVASPADAGFDLVEGFPIDRNDLQGDPFIVRSYIWTKPVIGDGANYTINHPDCSRAITLLTLRGADLVNPITITPTSAVRNGLDHSQEATAPSITSLIDNSLLYYWLSGWDNLSTTVLPAGLTLRNTRTDTIQCVMTQLLSSQGATGDKIATGPPLDDPSSTGLIVINPAQL